MLYRFGRGCVLCALLLGLLSACSAGDLLRQEPAATPLPTPTTASLLIELQGLAELSPVPSATVAELSPVPSATVAEPSPAPAMQPVSQPAAAQILAAQEQVIADVFRHVGPSVVRIQTDQGLGSGWLIDRQGYVITNNHVVADAQSGRVRVAFTGLFETVGQVVGTDPDSDIAVVKVEDVPQDAEPLALGDSEQVQVGQMTIAIGNPLGQDRTVTVGIVSAIGRTIAEDTSSYQIGGAIQTDAAINPGNSGGPLLNASGQLIGMNTAILSQSGTSSGIGFAIPVNLIKKVAQALIQSGSYEHPYLGVGLRTVTTYDAKQNNLPSAGILIAPNTNDSPVAQAGLRGQAILTAVNGAAIASSDDLISFLELKTSPGDTVTLTLIAASGQQQDLQVKLGARPNVADRPAQ